MTTSTSRDTSRDKKGGNRDKSNHLLDGYKVAIPHASAAARITLRVLAS